MGIDLQKIVLVHSEYHQYHGEGTYKNHFAEKVEKELREYLEFSERNSLQSGSAHIDFHNNKEVKVKVAPNVRGRHVYYFHDFRGIDGKYDPNVGYMALFAVEDAITGIGRADSLTLALPHIPYLRGDWAPESRVPIAAKLFAQQTEKAAKGRLEHIITFDLHAQQEIAFYDDVRPDDLPFRPIALQRFKNVDGEFAAVALDEGGAKRAHRLAKSLAKIRGINHIPTILIDKSRPRDSKAEVHHVVGNPSGRICVALEDIIDTGGTVVEGAKALFAKKAKEVYVCAKDGLFSHRHEDGKVIDPLPLLRESGAKIIISDTIDHPKSFFERNKGFVEVLSVTSIVARAIYEIETRGSVSKLYED